MKITVIGRGDVGGVLGWSKPRAALAARRAQRPLL